MSKKVTNLDVVTEMVKEVYPFQSRGEKLAVLKTIAEKLTVSSNNASVYVAKAIKRIEGDKVASIRPATKVALDVVAKSEGGLAATGWGR